MIIQDSVAINWPGLWKNGDHSLIRPTNLLIQKKATYVSGEVSFFLSGHYMPGTVLIILQVCKEILFSIIFHQ